MSYKEINAFSTITRAFLVASSLYLLSHQALAADSPAQEIRFSALDANKDGVIDQEEAKASTELSKVFQSADSDQDGKLSLEEFTVAITLIK